MSADDLKADLAQAVRFVLRLRLTSREARKAIRALPDNVIARMADDIAAHLLLAGWHHRPRSETDFSGPSLMTGLPPRSTPWPKDGDKD